MKAATNTPPLLDWLSLLSDLARVRLLRLLQAEELSVGELARAVQLPQSTVSRHLKALLDQGWIVKRSEGTASLYRVSIADLHPAAGELWTLTTSQMADTPTFDDDDARLGEVIAERRMDSRSFFGTKSGEWDDLRQELFGDQFTQEALLGLLPTGTVVADLGCGTGNASQFLAPLVSRVIAIDREPAMLEAARKRLDAFTNVEFRQGELTALPLKDSEVNAAVVFLVLHHLDAPEAVVKEVARALAPGGLALIVDMVVHDRTSYRHSMGHVHLGFAERDLQQWATNAGLENVRFRRLRPNTAAKGPGLFLATMRKRPA